jgi:predicted methyltransferase
MPILDVIPFAHHLVRSALRPGDVAVDATCGNGHDTVRLADAVGTEGRVFAFDVQQEAMQQTQHKVESRVPEVPVELVHDSHATLREHLPDALHGRVGAVTFNLGYLPGADHSVITRPDSTLAALQSAVEVLRPGGIVTVVLYTGHEGGPEEAEAVEAWAASLDQSDVHVLSYRFPNRRNDPPRLVAIEKRDA